MGSPMVSPFSSRLTTSLAADEVAGCRCSAPVSACSRQSLSQRSVAPTVLAPRQCLINDMTIQLAIKLEWLRMELLKC